MEVVYGGFWRRWLAFWIDAALTIVILMPLLGLLGVHDAGFSEAVHHSARSVMLNVPYIVASTLFLHFKGATPGKMVMGLRVVDADTFAPLTLAQAFGRQLASLLSLFFFFLGFI